MHFRVQCGNPGAMIWFLVSQREWDPMRPHNGKLGVNTGILSNCWHCWWKIEELWGQRRDVCIQTVGLKLNVQKTKIMTSGPIISWQIDGKQWKHERLYFSGLQNHCRWWLQSGNEKTLDPWKKSYDQPAAAATAAKSLQSCPTLCDPIDGNPPGSPVPGILQAKTLEWVTISFSNAWKWKVKVKSLSRVQLSVTPWTAAHQAPPSMGFSRQEYWSGVPFWTAY